MISPVQYLEQRIATLRATEPVTPTGKIERDAVVHELNNILMAFQMETLLALEAARRDYAGGA